MLFLLWRRSDAAAHAACTCSVSVCQAINKGCFQKELYSAVATKQQHSFFPALPDDIMVAIKSSSYSSCRQSMENEITCPQRSLRKHLAASVCVWGWGVCIFIGLP